MNSRLMLLLAGVLSAVSAWLPWTDGTIKVTGFQGEFRGNPGLFFVVLGAIILIMALINKKWSSIVALLFSLCVAGLAVKYYMDGSSGDAKLVGVTVGYGIYVMLAAGVLGVVGSFMGIMAKKKVAAV